MVARHIRPPDVQADGAGGRHAGLRDKRRRSGACGQQAGQLCYLRFTVPTQRAYSIAVTGGPAVSDPDFVVYQGRRAGQGLSTVGGSETGSVTLAAGEAVLVVNDFNNSAASTCFTVTVN